MTRLDRIAYGALARVSRRTGPLAIRFQRKRVRKEAARGNLFSPVFIVGPPRCGSTILYQAMTNYFDILYIDNLADSFAPAMYTGMQMSMRRFGRRPHGNFVAEFGTTGLYGGCHAPSECGGLWYRWIPHDQHYVASQNVTSTMVRELRDEIGSIQNRWQRPMLIKNLHVGQRIAWVAQAFPAARYICIHRDVDDVVRSIVAARRKLSIPAGELWSTRPDGYLDISGLSEVAMVRAQVDRLSAQIESDLSALPPTLVRHIRYEDMSSELLVALGDWLDFQIRPGGSLPKFETKA